MRKTPWIAVALVAALGVAAYFAWSGQEESRERPALKARSNAPGATREPKRPAKETPSALPRVQVSGDAVDSLVESLLDSSSPGAEASDGMRLVESSDVLLAGLVGALPSLRRTPGAKISSNGRSHPLVRELRIEGTLGDWTFTEKLMSLRHTVLLAGRGLQMEFVWLRHTDADIVPRTTYVIIEFLDGPLAGKKWMTVMYIHGDKLDVNRRVWQGDSFGTPPGAIAGSFRKEGGFLRDAFVKNSPDASFKSFVNW